MKIWKKQQKSKKEKMRGNGVQLSGSKLRDLAGSLDVLDLKKVVLELKNVIKPKSNSRFFANQGSP